jgi:hypothetical protein
MKPYKPNKKAFEAYVLMQQISKANNASLYEMAVVILGYSCVYDWLKAMIDYPDPFIEIYGKGV